MSEPSVHLNTPSIRTQQNSQPQPENLIVIPRQHQHDDPTQLLKAVEQLGNLAAAINEFKTQFVDLQTHFDFVKRAIDKISEDGSVTADAENPVTVTAVNEVSSSKSEALTLCEAMCGKGLRRYVISNLFDVVKLRKEVPLAIKRSPKPAKLVLDCIGRFYLQGSKAYTKKSPMISGREASVLVLEFYLLVMENEEDVEGAVRHEAEEAALAWRKRIVSEGGFAIANEIDARGLLLFIACYGIPKAFRNEDIWNLARVSDLRRIGEALRNSRVFMERISEILEGMLKNGMKIEAVDVAQRLNIEDKFPPQKLLTSLLRDSKEALKRRRRDANNSPFLLKEANEKHLVALKSVMKFLEDRKLDPAKILPGWQFKEKIEKLQKDIVDLNIKIDEKAMAKRKADENAFLNNLKNKETKRQRFSGRGTPLTSSPAIALRDQRIISHLDGQSSYGGYNYSVPSHGFYGSGASSLSENNHGATGGGVVHTAAAAAAAAADLVAVYGHDPTPTTSSYAGIAGEIGVDRVGHISNHVQPYSWQVAGSSALGDRSLNQSLVRQPSSGSYLISSSIEGFPGLPNSPSGASGASGVQTSTSDLYRFADAIAEEYNNGGRITDHQHLFLGTHNLSYKQ